MTGSIASKRGFALLAVLWVLVGVAALGLLLQTTASDAQGAAGNRMEMTRSRWSAEGCLARASAAVAEATDGAVIADSVWRRLDTVIVISPVVAGCHLELIPTGITLDVNTATEQQLRRLAMADGVPESAADSIASAILDWVDPDDDPRAEGAERRWYDSIGTTPPPNGPIGSISALRGVRGGSMLPGMESLLGTESGRILLARAPLPVLATLPGFDAGVLAAVAGHRANREQVSLATIFASTGKDSRHALSAVMSPLSSFATELPDAWLIRSTAAERMGGARVTIELRVVRSGPRLAVLRRRAW